MDEVNKLFLELPEHLRHLVAKAAPHKVEAACIELEVGDERIILLVGAWPLMCNPKKNNYWVRVFMKCLGEESKPFLRIFDQFRCGSQVDYENYQSQKIEQLICNGDFENKTLVRHFVIEGMDEQLEFRANQREILVGLWRAKIDVRKKMVPFSHQIFTSLREFYELSDEIVLARIQHELNDSDKEINFAYRWLMMEEAERYSAAFFCENGTWDELKELFRFLLINAMYQFKIQSELHWNVNGEDFHYEDWKPDFEIIWLPFIDLWRKNIYECFKPKYFLANQWKPECISQLRLGEHLSISVLPPTAHELIDAQLTLSNWAHENCSPDEVARLLTFEP